jgi:hypothetical protein
MSPEDDPSDPPRKTRVLITVAVAALVVAFVVLHLSGVLGPGSH